MNIEEVITSAELSLVVSESYPDWTVHIWFWNGYNLTAVKALEAIGVQLGRNSTDFQYKDDNLGLIVTKRI